MIDDMDRVEILMEKLNAALPFPARVPPALMSQLRPRSATGGGAADCMVKSIFYMGDGGGIMCGVALDDAKQEEAIVVSITQLAFDRRLPAARDIASYQKNRIKRIRRANALERFVGE